MDERLDSWKEIASYLGREVRTVQRWEAERSLPVHRLPGAERPRVYALKSELDRWMRSAPAEAPVRPSIAVLPFFNLSGDQENEYFSDGLADDIITALACLPGLQVTARTSSFAFRGKQVDVREVGARLGVRTLLEGSVRREGNRVRVTAQLVSARDGYHLWGQSYDRELHNVFDIQDDIAREITRALELRVLRAPLVRRWTADPGAYELWLKGRYLAAHWTRESVGKAMENYTAATQRDPRFPLPYVAMADLLIDSAWFGLAPPRECAARARALLTQALAIDEGLGEAHSAMGVLQGTFEYDWEGAERSFERAGELSPGSTNVMYRHAWMYLSPLMRQAEAVAELREATGQDPLSPLLHGTLGYALIEAREYAAAEEACRVALRMAPGMWWTHFFLCSTLAMQGRGEEAMAHMQEVARYTQGPLLPAATALVYGLSGREREALAIQRELEATGAPALALAWAYLATGDDRVFAQLEQAIEQRQPAVTHMGGMPIYDRVREDPRFTALMARMNLYSSG